MANNEQAEKIITAFRAKLVNDRLTRDGLVRPDDACEVLREVLQGDAPARLETGPYRPSPNDWTGIFVRGDDAVQYAQSIRLLLAGSSWEFLRDNLRGLASLLESSNESADVRTPVPAMEPKCGARDWFSPRVCDKPPHGADEDHDDSTLPTGATERIVAPSVPAAKEETACWRLPLDEFPSVPAVDQPVKETRVPYQTPDPWINPVARAAAPASSSPITPTVGEDALLSRKRDEAYARRSKEKNNG